MCAWGFIIDDCDELVYITGENLPALSPSPFLESRGRSATTFSCMCVGSSSWIIGMSSYTSLQRAPWYSLIALPRRSKRECNNVKLYVHRVFIKDDCDELIHIIGGSIAAVFSRTSSRVEQEVQQYQHVCGTTSLHG